MLVLSIWVVMTVTALVNWQHGSRNVPFSEDWLLVPALTGDQPNLPAWLWSQHNEHRVPVPRLVLLGLLRISHGDFRVGGALNILLLSAIALALLETARSVRGGKQRSADAFFPVALLHLGHTENMLWSWQFTQVLPLVLFLSLLAVIASGRFPVSLRFVVLVGVTLFILPLSGANGLLFLPLFAFWAGHSAVQLVRGRYPGIAHASWAGPYLLCTSLAALLLCGLYFVDFELPSYGAQKPTLPGTLYGSLQFLALGFGPAARSAWVPFIIATACVLLPAFMLVIRRLASNDALERLRVLGLAVCGCNIVLTAAAIGRGRAEVLALWGGFWPARYSLFAVPALCTAYFAYELYGSARVSAFVQYALFAAFVLLIPVNARHGAHWHQWYLEGAGAFERDLRAGESVARLAERNREYLYRWMNQDFDKLRMLRESGLGLFKYVPRDAPAPRTSVVAGPPQLVFTSATTLVKRRIHFRMAEAEEVTLVWGMNGWLPAPEMLRPAGTALKKNNVMHTPMNGNDGSFETEVSVPPGTVLDYCFLISKTRYAFEITWPICEGDHHERIAAGGVTSIISKTSLAIVVQEIRYHSSKAKEVELVWGLNGWHPAPESLRPKGTRVVHDVMHSPMTSQDGTFAILLSVPTDTPLDYGFQITERRGLFDLPYGPVFDGNYALRTRGGSVVDIDGKDVFP